MVTHVCGGTCRVRGCLRPFTAAGLASSYVLCMVGATWHDDVDIDAIEVFVTAPQAEWAGEDGTFRVYKFRV